MLKRMLGEHSRQRSHGILARSKLAPLEAQPALQVCSSSSSSSSNKHQAEGSNSSKQQQQQVEPNPCVRSSTYVDVTKAVKMNAAQLCN
jgi:hypothetical protein